MNSTGVDSEDQSSADITDRVKSNQKWLLQSQTLFLQLFSSRILLLIYFALLLKEKQIKLQVACLDWHMPYGTSVEVPGSEGWLFHWSSGNMSRPRGYQVHISSEWVINTKWLKLNLPHCPSLCSVSPFQMPTPSFRLIQAFPRLTEFSVVIRLQIG